MEIVPSTLAAITTNFSRLFQDGLRAVKTNWQALAMLIASSAEVETQAWLDEVDELREWIGPRQVLNLAARAQSLTNKEFERTIGVKRTHIEDDKLGLYAPRISMLAYAAGLWPDKLVVDALLAGETAECYDGQNFFDGEHPVDVDDASKGTQANLHTTCALTSGNYQTVRAAAMKVKGRSGVPIGLVPNLLVVPPALEATALEVCKAEMIAAAAAAKTNVMRGTAEVLVLPRLAMDSDTSWYLACTTLPIKPLIFQQRTAVEFAALVAPDSEHVFKNGEYLYGVRARGAGGYGLWQLIHKCKA